MGDRRLVNNQTKKSRNYYHFTASKIFFRISKYLQTNWLFLLVLFLGIFLRFYRVPENLVFHGELGHNYLAIKNFISKGGIPLLGPPTSHSWLSFGPLFYWCFGPLFALFGYNPVFGGYFFAFLGSLLIFENYFFVSKLINRTYGLVSSYLLTLSPLFIALTRESRFISIVVIFIYPYLFFLYKYYVYSKIQFKKVSSQKRGLGIKYIFLSGLFLGLSLNFHFSPLIFIFVTLFLILGVLRKINFRLKCKHIIFFLAGVGLVNLPFIAYNITSGFKMITQLSMWIPYRILGFIGMYPKNTFSIYVLYSNILSLIRFVSDSYSWSLVIGLLINIIVVGMVFKSIDLKKNQGKLSFYGFLSVFFVIFYIGVFIHGDPPGHYYLPVYFFPILYLTLFVQEVLLKFQKYGGVVFLTFFTILNLVFLFSGKWFYKKDMAITNYDYIPYHLQLDVAQAIFNDSLGRKISISRVGENDQFEGNYAQNYMFLLWRLGNEPVNNSKLVYTIYENDARFFPDINEEIIYRNLIIVTRKMVL